jgi:hypothetical protein
MPQKEFFMKNKPKEAIAKGLSLPRDVVFGDFIISLTGNHVILNIYGCGLTVDFYSQEAMKVKGKIKRLEYV